MIMKNIIIIFFKYGFKSDAFLILINFFSKIHLIFSILTPYCDPVRLNELI